MLKSVRGLLRQDVHAWVQLGVLLMLDCMSLELEVLLDWVDRLSAITGSKIEERYHLRRELLPRWINYLKVHVDFLERYPEMASHGSQHVYNVTMLAAELLHPRLKEWEKGGMGSAPPINAEELMLLMAGIFLHDIGMSDIYRKEKELGVVRKEHGLLSKDIIHEGYRDSDPRNNLLPTFSSMAEVKLVEEICAHHQSKAPITEDEKKRIQEEGSKPIIPSLESITETAGEWQALNGQNINIIKVAGLLRLLDACDTQQSRVGTFHLTAARIQNNRRRVEEINKLIECTSGKTREEYKALEAHLVSPNGDG